MTGTATWPSAAKPRPRKISSSATGATMTSMSAATATATHWWVVSGLWVGSIPCCAPPLKIGSSSASDARITTSPIAPVTSAARSGTRRIASVSAIGCAERRVASTAYPASAASIAPDATSVGRS